MDDERQLQDLRIPSSERLALNACAEVEAQRVLCKTVGRAQCAAAIAERLPQSHLVCHFLDSYPAEDARELTLRLQNLKIDCSADLPQGEIDLFVLPVSRGGEAELTRDWLQQGFDRLAIGAQLVTTVDNPRDVWLHHELEKLGRNVDRTPKRHGVTYRLRKQKPLKRMRDFSCEFAFRDGENLIKAFSRPGVFSHRRLDVGARALIESMQIEPGNFVLDIGCGCGAVGLAAARRAEGVRVHAIDSNARAIECTLRGAVLNDLTTMTATQSAEGSLIRDGEDLSGRFDIAVGNPPYFSHYQIAEIFLQAAKKGLRSGGRIWMVTKHTEWLVARMQQLFAEVDPQEVRGYTVVSGRQK